MCTQENMWQRQLMHNELWVYRLGLHIYCVIRCILLPEIAAVSGESLFRWWWYCRRPVYCKVGTVHVKYPRAAIMKDRGFTLVFLVHLALSVHLAVSIHLAISETFYKKIFKKTLPNQTQNHLRVFGTSNSNFSKIHCTLLPVYIARSSIYISDYVTTNIRGARENNSVKTTSHRFARMNASTTPSVLVDSTANQIQARTQRGFKIIHSLGLQRPASWMPCTSSTT